MLINKGKRSEGWTICVFLHTVTRIIRVIAQPRGNMLLIGIGGSGRQSLSRLSAYIIGFKVFQIEVTKHYRKNEFREGTYERIFARDLDAGGDKVLLIAETFTVCLNRFTSSCECFFVGQSEEQQKPIVILLVTISKGLICRLAQWLSRFCHQWHIFALSADQFIYLSSAFCRLPWVQFLNTAQKISTVITDSIAIKKTCSLYVKLELKSKIILMASWWLGHDFLKHKIMPEMMLLF